MKNLNQWACFAAVARHGSFAEAARKMGLAPSSVAKSVSRLENDLGIRLFNRTTRLVRLTEEGDSLFARSLPLLEEFETLEQSTRKDACLLQGTLRISTPIGYGIRKIVPVVSRLLEANPLLRVDMRLSDERADLINDGLDVAIRIGVLEDSGFTARPFDIQQLVLCASPSFLQKHGKIESVSQLETHQVIAFRMPSSGRERPLEFLVEGKVVRVRPSSRYAISHGDAMVAAALRGLGIIQVPEHMATQYLEAGLLKELLPQCKPHPLAVNAITPSSKMMPRKVRDFIDELVATYDISKPRH